MLKYFIIFILILIILKIIIEPIKKKIIFQPNKHIKYKPNNKYTEFNINTFDNKVINGWIIYPNKHNGLYILFSHGNAYNISYLVDFANIFVNQGYTFILYDYRGFGKSTGSPSEKGIFIDIVTVWNYITNTLKINSNNIIIFGNSLGSSVSSYLISKLDHQNITHKCTILQSPFYSLKHLSSDILPSLFKVLSIYIKEFNTYQYLENNKVPILLIHSKGDTLIPYKHSNLLLNKLKNNNKCYSELFFIKGNHNNLIIDNNYINKFNLFVNNIN